MHSSNNRFILWLSRPYGKLIPDLSNSFTHSVVFYDKCEKLFIRSPYRMQMNKLDKRRLDAKFESAQREWIL